VTTSGPRSREEVARPPATAKNEKLTARDATLLRELDEPTGWCLVMSDPEGNESCLH
jgi:hypothetical protein